MLREKQKLVVNAHKALDVCLTVGAFIAAYFIKLYFLPASFRGLTMQPNYYIVLLMIIIIWYLMFGSFSLYASYRRRTYSKIFWNMFKAVAAGMVLLFMAMYMVKLTDVSRILLVTFFLINIALLAASKGIVYKLLDRYRKKGFNFRNIVIIGNREWANDVIDTIGTRLGAGYRILGCLETNPSHAGASVKNGIKMIGTIDDLKDILTNQVVDELILAIPMEKIESADQHILMAQKVGVSVRIIPDWRINYLISRPRVPTISFEDFLGIPSLALKTTSASQTGLLIKSAFDLTVASILFMLLFPVFLIIACAIKITSPGPVFFKQERCALNGRRFMVYKFRTMVPDAEAQFDSVRHLNEAKGPVFKIKEDPRIIPYVGTFLRKTSLDEFPQIINVLKGEMSLVGPRPPIPAEVKHYDTWQQRRLSMKPGLTCTWQCAPKRNEIGFNEWIQMDLNYLENWSFWLDLKIIFSTVKAVFLAEGR